MFRRFLPFEVLVIDKYRYGENIFPRDVKFCPRTGNLPTTYQPVPVRGEGGLGSRPKKSAKVKGTVSRKSWRDEGTG
jgi:hypothetical protein